MQESIVTVYTDGACRGNPGIGAWAATLQHKQHKKEISGVVLHTTNNQMELQAAIEALKCLKHKCSVNLYTDSIYVQKGITIWIKTWKVKGWKKIKNVELWKQLDELNQHHKINWCWVRGHSGNTGNECVDALANQAIDKYLANNTKVV